MRLRTAIFIALVVVAGFLSCKKGNDSVAIKQYTNVNFINATGDTLNVYVNGSRVNTTNSIYPLGSSGYVSALLGEQNYQVRKYRSADVLFNLPVPLDTGKVYSFYLAGNTAEQTFTDVDTLSSTPDTTLIRFVHTSPNAGAVDIRMNDTLQFENRAFKSTSVFKAISPGDKRIQIYKAGTNVLLSDETRTFLDSRAYTLFTKSGLSGDGGNTSGTGLVINK